MKHIAIIGAGQSGMQLALGLLGAGHAVTVVSSRTAQEIRLGPVMSSQCMFETALQAERDLGLNWWDDDCPPVEGIGLAVPGTGHSQAIEWAARLVSPAQSVDQRGEVAHDGDGQAAALSGEQGIGLQQDGGTVGGGFGHPDGSDLQLQRLVIVLFMHTQGPFPRGH